MSGEPVLTTVGSVCSFVEWSAMRKELLDSAFVAHPSWLRTTVAKHSKLDDRHEIRLKNKRSAGNQIGDVGT